MSEPNTTKFQYFTYFLNPLKQLNLMDDKRDKNAILREALSNTFEYKIRGKTHAYARINDRDNYFVAKIGRQSKLRRSGSPKEGFTLQDVENWPNCWVIINTNEQNGLGQKIAFEHRPHVFSSANEQLKHLADQINTHLFPTGYAMAVNPVTEEKDFWALVDENQNKIEKLTLTFNVPNLFKLQNALSDDLKQLQTEYGSTEVSIDIKNPDGKLIVPHNPLTEQGIDYIAKGGGQYKLKVKGKKNFIYSKKNIKTRSFSFDLELEGDNQDVLFNTLDKLFE